LKRVGAFIQGVAISLKASTGNGCNTLQRLHWLASFRADKNADNFSHKHFQNLPKPSFDCDMDTNRLWLAQRKTLKNYSDTANLAIAVSFRYTFEVINLVVIL